MHRQYRTLKAQVKRDHPDAIVFFRLGDFYETFDEDAAIVAQVCDVVPVLVMKYSPLIR